MNVTEMMASDVYGNTPVHYAAAKRLTANATNIQLTNCRILVAKELFEETYYIQKVLCANNTPSVRNFEQKLANPDKYFSYDEKMFKVLKYSLNEYSLLDTAYRLSPTFTSSDVSKLQSNQSLSDTNSATNDCLSIIIDCADVVDSQRTVQEALNNMDEEVYNGKPKENKEQVKEAVQKEARIHQPSQDYSSFSAKNSANFQHHVQNYLLITGERRGRALIICNNVQLTADSTKPDKTISSLRQETLQTALKVLGEHFRLQVVIEQDLSASEMLDSISSFSKEDGHGAMAALAVFSHGTNRMIAGHDGSSSCQVQEVVDLFNSGNVHHIPKLIFLSCCRGDLPATYSRAPFSFESSAEFPWSENEIELLYKPTRIPLSIEDRNREWSRLSFPPLEVPVDCYVCFTTLPDSKSKAGKFFKYLSEHLSQLTATSNKDGATTPTNANTSVELTDLLTDAAGILREKFQSKQFANLCYTHNRHSKWLLIDVFPVSSARDSLCQ
ncbi:hypothetical protein EB796_014945 [Bugula neritina]|uniref:Caspase family p20 domain-containing protein n=1 Tax=Bugula neritina TaxID=10212 RepID=A0A7J7JK61_BUGNE|nr:hypothetical protein EB796_014945 [Bugula neritina]